MPPEIGGKCPMQSPTKTYCSSHSEDNCNGWQPNEVLIINCKPMDSVKERENRLADAVMNAQDSQEWRYE